MSPLYYCNSSNYDINDKEVEYHFDTVEERLKAEMYTIIRSYQEICINSILDEH